MAKVDSHDIADGVTYLCHPDHRNGSSQKSQWRIRKPKEVDSFRLTWNEQWVVDRVAWGLHVEDGCADYLGVAQDHQTRVFIAKFVSDKANDSWHGYPADHRRDTDRPADQVIGMWLKAGTLPPAKLRKVQKGEPCNL